MTVDPRQADAAQPPHVAQPRAYAALARRISSWTSKGLASALVLAAGLAFGSQVLRWWHADQTLPNPSAGLGAGDGQSATDGLGDPARQHQLRFGESPWSMTCRTVAASRQDALAMLRASCAELIRLGDGLPTTAPDDAERQWLDALGSRQPAQQEPGRWALYEMDEPGVMVVGTREGKEGKEEKEEKEEGGRRKEESRVASSPSSLIPHPSSFPSSPRVVTWGLAIAGEGSRWTLYTLQWMPYLGDASRQDSDSILPPCPPGSTQVLSVQASGGGAMVSFRGAADVEAWKRFFDSWLSLHHWKPGGPWRQYGLHWHLHCESGEAGRPGTLDLHVGPDGRGGWSGLVVVAL